ncbi:MAG: hypothetical protein ACI9XO_000368 [Paraglaciecola sp.]|jgi:hypothetical protein
MKNDFAKIIFHPQTPHPPRRRRGALCFLKLENLAIFSLFNFLENFCCTVLSNDKKITPPFRQGKFPSFFT